MEAKLKITKLRIKNLFGIKEYESDGSDVELTGTNGACKTAVLDAIRYGFTNKSDREYLIRKGQSEGEILIELSNGLKILRKPRIDKADYRSIRVGEDKAEKSEGFLREIFTELQLNPIDFLFMTEQEQNRIILDMIDFKWDLNWIKEQFGEIVPDVNYEQNILNVLHEIQADEGYYFLTRQDLNREVRNNLAFIEDIGATLPPGYDAAHWEEISLGDLYKKIAKIKADNSIIEKAKAALKDRDAKIKQFKTDFELEKERLINKENEYLSLQNTVIADLENSLIQAKERIKEIQRNATKNHEINESNYKANIASFEGEVKTHEKAATLEPKPFKELQDEAENAEKMKAFINEYKRMIEYQKEIVKLNRKADKLTEKIEHARALPGVILETSKIPVKGLSIVDGIPLIKGLPISNLCEGDKLELCVEVAMKGVDTLKLLLIDGVERLATVNRESLYKMLKRRGVQFVATRTTDDEDLTVIHL